MEEAAGRELFDVILEKQAIEEPRAKPILRQLTGALAYLHEHKIAHRDVKPENVLVSAVRLGVPRRCLHFHTNRLQE